ncbi:unnamed protein product [Rhizophagus irregularis]|nr:unnamed protein product [Rhizophagus irregularis]CAB5377101.1 unnamed protein product [Rhizophagus irregularis]
MYSPKSFGKEISFTIPDINIRQRLPTEGKLLEQSPLTGISGKTEMIVNQSLNYSPIPDRCSIENNNMCDNLNSFEKSNVGSNQSNLYNHCDPRRCQQYNHSCPNLYNQSNTQRIEEITTNQLVKEYQTPDQFDYHLKNHEHSSQRESLETHDTFSQVSRFEQPAYLLDNHSSHSNLNSEKNGSFNNNLVLTLPKPDPYSLSNEDEENRDHVSLYSGPMFRTTILDLQQLSFPQLQPSTQQENRVISIPTDGNYHLEPIYKDQVNDSNEMNNERFSPPASSEQLFPELPSFLEPRFMTTCCNELCSNNETYGDENSSLPNRNVIMSYSWNIVGNHCNNSLGSIQPFSQPTIPYYCWGDQVVFSPIHLTAANYYLEQAPARKCVLNNGMPENSLNETSNSYHFISKETKAFVENQGTSLTPNLSFLTIGSVGSNINEYDIYQKFVAHQIQPKIDMNDTVPETPEPPVDPSDTRLDAKPRNQKLKYPGDMYTPQWVRYSGHIKEGYCDNCKPGKWLQLKNSAYWYHKQFFHGISSVSGKMFVPPVETRKSDAGDCTEGLCHQCRQWVTISTTKKKNSFLWFRHAHKCHVYIKPKSYVHNKRR